MKVFIAAFAAGVLLVACSQERSPYTAADETNNPPRIEPAFTNKPVAPATNSLP